MSQARVIRFDEVEGFSRAGGSVTKPLVGSWIGAQGFSSGVAIFQPGGISRPHSHNVEEAFMLLDGDLQFEMEGRSYHLNPLDTIYIPAGVSHSFQATGDSPTRCLWIYATTYITRTFTDSGETVQHLSPEDIAGGKGKHA